MKALLVYPDIFDYGFARGTFYSGIASISAVLKMEASGGVSLRHLSKPVSRDKFISRVKEQSPGLVAFSSTTNMYPYVKSWASWIKAEFPGLPLICGGMQAIMDPEEVIANPNIDIACIGEGEYPLSELCNSLEKGLDFSSIPGLWVKDARGVHKNKPRPLIPDLDTLPFPDRDIFDYKNLHYESQGRAAVMLSRGCPYSCNYCCNGALRKIYNTGYVRFRGVKSSIEELLRIKENYAFVKRISFEDDILPLNKDWFREFAREYGQKVGMPYDCNLRPNLINEEVAGLLKSSGCLEVRIGIESGSDYIRNEILGRDISREQIVNACRLCRDAGIRVYSFNMVGLPQESLEMMLETLRLNSYIDTSANQVTLFYPYKKTPLFEACQKEGLINERAQVTDYSSGTTLKLDLLSKNRALFMQRYFRILVKLYRRMPGPMRRAFEKIIFSSLSSLLVLPLLTRGMDAVIRNKYLSLAARKAYRRFLKG